MEYKVCTMCGRQLPVTEFYKKGVTSRGKVIIASECKDCFKLRERQRYLDKSDEMRQYKKPCAKCGESKHYLIEFHHVDTVTKDFTIAEWRKHSKEALLAELQKCDTLCKNCHAEFHYLNSQTGLTYADYLLS